jgi:hypothetical protein
MFYFFFFFFFFFFFVSLSSSVPRVSSRFFPENLPPEVQKAQQKAVKISL